MGVAGMILGVFGLALSIIPNIGWILTTICLVTGTSLSIIGLIQNRRGGQEYRRAILGIATNVAVIIIMVIWIYVFLEWAAIDPQ